MGIQTHFMQVAKHSPETCPMYSDKYLQMTMDWFNGIKALSSKYDIELIGMYNDHPAHIVYMFWEAPSSDAMMAFMAEPANQKMLCWQTMETKPVLTGEEIMQKLQK